MFWGWFVGNVTEWAEMGEDWALLLLCFALLRFLALLQKKGHLLRFFEQ